MWRLCAKQVHPKTITLRTVTPGKAARQQYTRNGSMDDERDWPPCEVVLPGWQTIR